MRRRPCRRSYRPAPENRSRSRSDCSSKNCCHASCVCPYRSPQKLSFISARKCWKCSLIGIIFAIGCRSPFQERISLVRQSQLTPSRLLHNQRYVTCSARLVISLEVVMVGGLRLIWALGFVMFAAVLWSEDGSSTTTNALAAPPKAKVEVVEYNIHGHKIADPYRWMEDSNSPATEEYVREQLAYTRSILDPLPGRAQIHERLKELLSIGTIGTPQIGGKYYFYTRR